MYILTFTKKKCLFVNSIITVYVGNKEIVIEYGVLINLLAKEKPCVWVSLAKLVARVDSAVSVVS